MSEPSCVAVPGHSLPRKALASRHGNRPVYVDQDPQWQAEMHARVLAGCEAVHEDLASETCRAPREEIHADCRAFARLGQPSSISGEAGRSFRSTVYEAGLRQVERVPRSTSDRGGNEGLVPGISRRRDCLDLRASERHHGGGRRRGWAREVLIIAWARPAEGTIWQR